MNRIQSVAIVGGGLGGLALAQGLSRAGIEVTVYERDPSPDGRAQGYRLSLDAMGRAALAALLPPELAARLPSLEAREVGRGFCFAGADLRPLFRFPTGTHDVWTVSRPRLRALVASGLSIAWGRRLVALALDEERPLLRFDDGSTARADLVVGADGVGSAVREQLRAMLDARAALPVVRSAGLVSVGGCLPRTAAWDARLPLARDGAVQHLGPGGRSLFVSFCERPDGAPIVLWAATSRAEQVGPRARIVLDENWHPALRRLCDETPLESYVEPLLLRTTTLPRRIDGPLAPGAAVTLLGDAAHTMPPQRGVGANNAFEDARQLVRQIVDGEGSRVERIVAYEREMLARARRAIEGSDEAARLCHVANPVGARLRDVALRLAGAGAAARAYFVSSAPAR
jgi:2-polyprenyl-6-methoxyphenol hydroxylase-like FAD-dependent oxidoreductase